MKKIYIIAFISILLLCSCARSVQSGVNDASKRYFDAWLQKNYPNLVGQQHFPGFYVIEETEGTGASLLLYELIPYVRADYRIIDLDGNISYSSYEQDAYKLRTHTDVAYYGPTIFDRTDDALFAGIEYSIREMKVGGKRTIIVPGWLATNDRYETEDEYIKNVSGSDAIYTIDIKDGITDITQWEQDSVSRYVSSKYPYSVSDTAGFHKVTLKEPVMKFENDTTIYINYIGRRLDGKVFDTNIADTAKFYGLWSSSGTYEPTLINWKKEDYTEITMTSSESSVITGFALLLSKMGDKEKAKGIFTSAYGYSYSGSGDYIPAYCPLEFEVEIVEQEE